MLAGGTAPSPAYHENEMMCKQQIKLQNRTVHCHIKFVKLSLGFAPSLPPTGWEAEISSAFKYQHEPPTVLKYCMQ
jgi:hypothetical protein